MQKYEENFLTQNLVNFEGFSLNVEDMIVWMPDKKPLFRKLIPKKAIIKGITVEIKAGSMTAIVGPSGSGKTTFMNYLAGRQNQSQMFKTYANYYVNGSKIANINNFKNIIGYVMQEDIMEERMTPRTLFEHYARLRGLPNIEQQAQKVLDILNLGKCADTKIGGSFTRGVSGGEKKRTSIGIELISNPNLLFLDEPTTGLDSTTAKEIMQNLYSLKQTGITIITTIHQPSNEILALFDQIIILCNGQLIYNAPPSEIEQRLSHFQFKLPEFQTPVEYFMKVIDKDDVQISFIQQGANLNNEEIDEIYDQRIAGMVEYQTQITQQLRNQFVPTGEENLIGLTNLSKRKNQQINFCSQFIFLTALYTKLFMSNAIGILTRSALFYGLVALNAALFHNLGAIGDNTQVAIQNRAGFYFLALLSFFFQGNNVYSSIFVDSKQILQRDRQTRMYHHINYFLAILFHLLPLYLTNVTIACIIYYYGFGLNNSPTTNMAWLWGFGTLSFLAGSALGLIVGSIADKIENISSLTPIIVLPFITIAGFFVSVKALSWPLRILSYISTPRFIYQGMMLTEFQNRQTYINNCFIPCPGNPIINCGVQQICDPQVQFNFDENTIWLNFVVTAVLVFGFLLVGLTFFMFKNREKDARMGFDQDLYDQFIVSSESQQRITNNQNYPVDQYIYSEPNDVQWDNVQQNWMLYQ